MAISLLHNREIKMGYGEGQRGQKVEHDPKFSFSSPKFRDAITDRSKDYVSAEDTAAAHDVYSRVINGQGSSRLS